MSSSIWSPLDVNLDDFENFTDPNKGAAYVGYGEGLGYPANTVGKKLNDLTSADKFNRSGGVIRFSALWFSYKQPEFIDYLTDAEIADIKAGTLVYDFSGKLATYLNAGFRGERRLPAGQLKLSSPVVINRNDIALLGQGKGGTIICPAFASGDVICVGDGVTNPNNVTVAALGFFSLVTRTFGALLRARNHHQVTFRDFRVDNVGATIIDVSGGPEQYITHIDDYEINSGAVHIRLGEDGTYPQQTFIGKGTAAGATDSGILLKHCGEVTIDGYSSINCRQALSTFPGPGQIVQDLKVTRLLADTTTQHGVALITNGGQVSDVTFDKLWASTCGTSGTWNGVIVDEGTGFIQGVKFTTPEISRARGHGMALIKGKDIRISVPQICDNGQAAANTYDGIFIAAGLLDFSISGGVCGLAGYYPSNAQRYGITVAAGVSDFYSIIGVDVRGNTTGGLNDLGSGVTKQVKSNIGYNPIPEFSVTVSASPTSFLNNLGDTMYLYIQGGTVSQVTVNSRVVASSTNVSVPVPQGATAVVTYSSAPTLFARGS